MKSPRGNHGKKVNSSNIECPDESNLPVSTFTFDQLTKLLNLLKEKSPETLQSCNVSGFSNQESPGDW
ncbi:hypothetical protein HanRHA438_Chr08g0361191 [Helianthus annuus]|nr:hypothetical protein HanHA89_Chr08g0306301 [Helianthus annuus]KAJ0898824.1 hypothetical protein HanRHA438_Chr08g0361191 [Helianthus annuus]KAJ0902445.1 hypothetical protein HanPSC8_Chr08g0337111 [Helianthus annuus]